MCGSGSRSKSSKAKGAQLGSVDLVLVEFAINEEPDCRVAAPRMGRLVGHLREHFPTAAFIFINVYDAKHDDLRQPTHADAAACFEPLARHHGIASLSWKDAVRPLLQAGRMKKWHILERPMCAVTTLPPRPATQLGHQLR